MSTHLQMDLERLQRDLRAMGDAVEAAVRKAVAALRRRDPALARQVIDGDDDIDDAQDRIEEECLKALALHQPVAMDLRQVAAVRMATVDLERMGDLAESIACRAAHLAGFPEVAVPADFRPLAEAAFGMVREALDAFVGLDARQARAVCRRDNEADRLCAGIIAELAAAMRAGGPDAVEPGLSLFTAVRHLERIADHATNIAEDVIYLVEGEIVRHRPECWADE
jgi:phosphate transport system protein